MKTKKYINITFRVTSTEFNQNIIDYLHSQTIDFRSTSHFCNCSLCPNSGIDYEITNVEKLSTSQIDDLKLFLVNEGYVSMIFFHRGAQFKK
jgi:hypothetical protein